MVSRRNFFAGAAAMVGAGLVSRVGAASLPEAVVATGPGTQAPLAPNTGRPYNPVVTLNGWSLPWRMNRGVKEFHLVAEPVVREIAPGMKANLWGYNGQSPGPTIEVVEGDQVRIFVTNRLPENTSIHWHGQRLPNGMDGVTGLTQPGIPPGKTFVYEFVAKRAGTFMYHPHGDEMVQMAMGMMGSWVTHPKNPDVMRVDRDFVLLLAAYDIEPGSFVPKVNTMLDFNLWTMNSRVFPGVDSMNVRQGDKVRMRIGNLTMTNHPMHIHGHEFVVAGTDGGWIRPEARWPEVVADIGVGQMRALEFVADEPGDWAFHCHKSHHTMNAMGHNVPTMIGVSQQGIAEKINKLIPDYMAMGEKGGSMGGMEMPLPENTLPMMSGDGPFGGIEMGGMMTLIKVRRDQKPGDYSDPGWYRHPKGTVAYEWTGEAPAASKAPGDDAAKPGVELKARRPQGHDHH
ncbi:Multicopper oxidase with three cupredoxin domains (includes cell division protein FtsP and spore coat protein CotA) [Noviherbaspirillum humi]|uniref:Multicopper oxidase with three cupredoxin domains (Includes cell division protein FtsP and spore coat protein CotA) n=1 Tax=Noviherbaspirillum humi TaxID=1688639 RepID=A0A239EVG2_9BURK|nr:copper oxidase [Noviherbaspirillum humi]SNS48656.1 Multicopper oxidase with three cupredoxin domains (includes cell division protein FtsP and spore coat protein CotA) [Noviherbaspirillum humi]